jgi:transcriptional regulator with PAS, ATPase and Fis domain
MSKKAVKPIKSIGQGQDWDFMLDEHMISVFQQIFDPIPVPIILIDRDTKILMINQCFADFLDVKREEALGRKVIEVDRNSRFPYVFQSKRAEIAWKHTFQNGQTAIVHRIPVLDADKEVMYGFGLVLFQDMDEFKNIVEKNKLLESELYHYKKELKKIRGANYDWDNIIGNGLKMSQVKFMGKKAAQTDSTVLIVGESGTGKELFAHAIHNESKRNYNPFVKLNCAAIPSDLLESELFGYEEGAFTGAKKGGKVGKFELANGGSIFLDEIGDMPLNMQAKLLRVLQEREIERVGGTKTISIDVRVIAATNKNLMELVKKGEFREDLFYRLNIMFIELPNLRDRMEDLAELVNMLLIKLSSKIGKHVTKVSDSALEVLKNFQWPGNVRELENTLERAINIAEGDIILPNHLPLNIANSRKTLSDPGIRELGQVIQEAEREAIIKCLEYTKGNKLKTAKLLNISRTSLYQKIDQYNIEY